MAGPNDFQVVRAPPLMQAMFLEGECRWTDMSSSLRQSYSDTLELLILREWLMHPLALTIPITKDLAIRAALRSIRHAPAESRIEKMVKVSGLTERTFRRRFERSSEAGWRTVVRRVRVMAGAMRLLDTPAEISRIAAHVGFASPSAFAAAFRHVFSQSPTGFARSVLARRGLS